MKLDLESFIENDDLQLVINFYDLKQSFSHDQVDIEEINTHDWIEVTSGTINVYKCKCGSVIRFGDSRNFVSIDSSMVNFSVVCPYSEEDHLIADIIL